MPSTSMDNIYVRPPKLDLKALDGLRCMACLSIVLLHTHYFFGALFFPHEEPCMQSLFHLPMKLGPLFFNNSFQMPLFWILSGFLCEYQLDRLVDKNCEDNTSQSKTSLSKQQYGRFLFNRWLRLYPLYFFFNMVNYVAAINSTEETGASKCDNVQKLAESLFFVLRTEPYTATSCAGAGWSVMVDVHGYLAIVFFHFALGEKLRRRFILPTLYALALAIMSFQTWQLLDERSLLSWDDVRDMARGAAYSLRYQNNQSMAVVQYFSKVDIRALWSERYQFDSEFWMQLVPFRVSLLNANYFVSIHKNGSTMFLGSLLYLNMKHRQHSRGDMTLSFVDVMTRLVIAAHLFQVTSFCWMFSGLPVYLIVDVIISLTQQSTQKRTEATLGDWRSTAATVLEYTLNNSLWEKMSPYTYGIYMVHVFILALSTGKVYKDRAIRMQAGENICDDYTPTFIFGTVVKTWLVSWIVAVLLYHTVEAPSRWYRKRYTSFQRGRHE